MKHPLWFVVSYVQPVTQHFGSRTVRNAPLQSMHAETKKWCHTPQLYQLSSESEVSIMLRCRLCSTHYTAVQIKNCSKCISAIKITTMKNTDDSCYEVKPSRATARSILFAVSKDEWDTKEDTGKSIVCTAVCKRHLSG